MPVYFNNGIGMYEDRVERGKVGLCESRDKVAARQRRESTIPNQGMRYFVATRRIVYWYMPSAVVSSLANLRRICFALLSHVRISAVMIGDVSANTIADVDEKLCKPRHALCCVGLVLSKNIRSQKVFHLGYIDPFLVHLLSLIQVIRAIMNERVSFNLGV